MQLHNNYTPIGRNHPDFPGGIVPEHALSFNARHWEKTRYSGEIRPIVGLRIGPVDLICNAILETSFNGLRQLDFAPAQRIAYNFSQTWAAALEHCRPYAKPSLDRAIRGRTLELWSLR